MQLAINLTKNYTRKVNRVKWKSKKRKYGGRDEIIYSVTSPKVDACKTIGKTNNER
jgi:hypothetical protein